MKKQFFSVLALLFAVLICFSSCNLEVPSFINSNQNSQNSQNSSDEPDESTVDPSYQPYQLIYESLGDGTCRVFEFCPEQNIEKDYVLSIPEVSPEGDRVTGVMIKKVLPYLLPRVISAERFENMILAPLQKAVDDGMIDDFDLDHFCASYLKYDLSEQPNANLREEWVRAYPVIQEKPIYVLASDIRQEQREYKLQNLILDYTNYTYNDLLFDYKDVDYRDALLYHVVSIQMPETITMIYPDFSY